MFSPRTCPQSTAPTATVWSSPIINLLSDWLASYIVRFCPIYEPLSHTSISQFSATYSISYTLSDSLAPRSSLSIRDFLLPLWPSWVSVCSMLSRLWGVFFCLQKKAVMCQEAILLCMLEKLKRDVLFPSPTWRTLHFRSCLDMLKKSMASTIPWEVSPSHAVSKSSMIWFVVARRLVGKIDGVN